MNPLKLESLCECISKGQRRSLDCTSISPDESILTPGIVPGLATIAATQTNYGTAYFLFKVGTVQYECYEKILNALKCTIVFFFFLRMYSIVNGWIVTPPEDEFVSSECVSVENVCEQ